MAKKSRVAVLGAGAFAGVVIHTLRAAGFIVRSVFDDNGGQVAGIEVCGRIADYLPFRYLVPALIAIGSNAARRKIADLVGGAAWATLRAPQSVIFPDTVISPGAIIVAGAVIEHGVFIGRHTIIDSCAEVAHDCRMGDFVHVSANVTLGGGVEIGEGALLGLGCVILPKVKIGEWAVIGAGAVVLHDVEPRTVMVGNPARILKRLNPEG